MNVVPTKRTLAIARRMAGEASPNACASDPDLFLSTERRDHVQAAAICDTCPALDWCRNETKTALRGPYGTGLHGTWAGVLYKDGLIISSRVSIGTCPDCGATDGKPCRSARGIPSGQPHLARIHGRPLCRICGGEFKASRRAFRYCSPTCAAEGARRRADRYHANRPSRVGERADRRVS